MSAQLVIIMKFIVTSGELQKALNTVSGVISSSQSRPILENFLFELENNLLKITASDGETTLLTSLAVKSESNGKIAVPAKARDKKCLSISLDVFKILVLRLQI